MTWEPFLIFFVLGLFHGINPGMGWLLATALGIQRKSRTALAFSVVALIIGHALAIAFAIFGIGWLKLYIPINIIQYVTIALLFSLGSYLLWRHWHPQWMNLNMGYTGVALWSFLIATAHGAGLMLIPFLLGDKFEGVGVGVLLLAMHVLGYSLATTTASFFLYETLQLTTLKSSWINFDLIWAISLLLTGTIFLIFLI